MTIKPEFGLSHLPFEIMAFGFQAKCLLEQPVNRRYALITHRFLEIHMHIGAEAHEYLAVGSEPQAVAIVAEVTAHRRYKAKA